ncbi:MAG: hypothetical protein IPM42_07705 [Saprospiraceae bacterium]|nr:hypothetical protein [Saprospiraceae bacterium]
MKIIYSALLVITFFLKTYSQDATFMLTGHRIVHEAGTDYYYVDAMSYSNQGFKLGSGQLYFTYDTTAFGPNIIANNKMEILLPSASILSKKIGNPPFQFNYYNNLITNDNTFNRVSFSWQHNFSNTCLDSMNMNYFMDVLFVIKIAVKPDHLGPINPICLESNNIYIHQTYTACGPNICNINDCLNHPGVQLSQEIYPCSDCRIVYSVEDNGPGTLREAINCALPGDTVRFAYSIAGDSILLTSNQIALNKHISVIANKNFSIYVNGSGTERVFDILDGNNVLLEGLSLISGAANDGAGIRSAGQLTLKDLTIYFDQNIPSNSHLLNNGELNIENNVSVIKRN